MCRVSNPSLCVRMEPITSKSSLVSLFHSVYLKRQKSHGYFQYKCGMTPDNSHVIVVKTPFFSGINFL